jgi:BTB/POZ domain-containing adapter for CUL3-mediated RhoA degradation protein
MTTIATLRSDQNSMLGRMFSGDHPILLDEDGSFVVDRDGRHFHHILNYLRDGSVPIGLSRVDRIELLKEIDYYGLRSLYSIVGGPTVAAAAMSGGGGGPWLQSLTYDLARAEACARSQYHERDCSYKV